MDSENYDVIHCVDDDEYRIHCTICGKLCKERFYKNHLNSQTHTNNIHKKENNSNISTYLNMEFSSKVCYREVFENESEYNK